MPTIIPMVRFGLPKPPGQDNLHSAHNANSDLLHHQYRLSVLQWNPGPTRKNPTQILPTVCGRFHAVILGEAKDHVLHVSDQFIAYTSDTDLGHMQAQRCSLRFSRSFVKQGHVGYDSSCGSMTFATSFPFWHPHGHVLLCSPSPCCDQEMRCLH